MGQSNPDGDVLHEITIQRGPKEFDFLTEHPGPRISCAELGLDLEPGPESIGFSGDLMTVIVTGYEGIEVDLSPLDTEDRKALQEVAKLLFE